MINRRKLGETERSISSPKIYPLERLLFYTLNCAYLYLIWCVSLKKKERICLIFHSLCFQVLHNLNVGRNLHLQGLFL